MDDARALVAAFWDTMNTNDFRAVGRLLADDFVLDWPQSGERIQGRDNFAVVNEQYPAAGPWGFTVHRLISEGQTVVTEVTVTDGARTDRSISFFEVRDGRIARIVEYWPEPFEAAAWRARWVERI